MDRTAYTEPQCLYKGALNFFYVQYDKNYVHKRKYFA
jgi:hypothetical protein